MFAKAFRIARPFLTLVLALGPVGFFGSTSFAGGGLFAPISMDSAAVMPKGVRNLRLAGFTTQVTDKYTGTGSIVPSANSFNKGITWNELINTRSDAFDRGQLKGGLQAEGTNLQAVVGDTQGLVNARVSSMIPVFAYGLTDKITVGVGLPIVYSTTHVDYGWVSNAYFQNELNRLQSLGYEPKILSFKSLLANVVQSKFDALGYQTLRDEQHTDIGDLNLGVKEQVYKNDWVAVALAQKLVVPTGRTPDVDKVVDLAPGDGHFGTGVSAVADFRASKWLTVTPSAGYFYQFETTTAARIPRSGAETISADTDFTTRIKRGDIMSSALALKMPVNDVFTPAVAYSLQYKNQDSIQGSTYSPERYQLLEVDTWQNMQSLQLALTASTISLFKKGQFALPLEGTAAWSHVLDGRNVSALDVAVFELAAYF
jgi:hypothetical protein